MGSTISYYFQTMIDYINEYDAITYYHKGCDDNDDDNNADSNADSKADSKADSNKEDFYKLFIYVHDFPGMDTIKRDYEANALKHNQVVEKYLDYCINLDKKDDKKDDIVYCYDSGFDLLCPDNISWYEDVPIYMLDYQISCAMTYNNKHVGYYLYSRSSTPIKTPLRMANNVGIIDSGYRGTIRALFDYNTSYSSYEAFKFVKFNRYVQLTPPNIGCPMKVYIVDDLSMLGKKNNRNENGFGSSGN